MTPERPSRALAAARQREEELKGEIARLKAQIQPPETKLAQVSRQIWEENAALRAENDRLTLAASESARTLQVEIERLKVQIAESEEFRTIVTRTTGGVIEERDALKNQVAALREALETHGRHSPACDIFMPPGTPCNVRAICRPHRLPPGRGADSPIARLLSGLPTGWFLRLPAMRWI